MSKSRAYIFRTYERLDVLNRKKFTSYIRKEVDRDAGFIHVCWSSDPALSRLKHIYNHVYKARVKYIGSFLFVADKTRGLTKGGSNMTNKRKLKRVRNSQSKAIKASDKRRRKFMFNKAVKSFNKYIGDIAMAYNRSRIGYTRASAILTAFLTKHDLV